MENTSLFLPFGREFTFDLRARKPNPISRVEYIIILQNDLIVSSINDQFISVHGCKMKGPLIGNDLLGMHDT